MLENKKKVESIKKRLENEITKTLERKRKAKLKVLKKIAEK